MINSHPTATLQSNVAIGVTTTELIVTTPIPKIAAENLEIRTSSWSVMIWGEQMERVKIDGYCDFSYPAVQFHKLINLPYPVRPETITIEFQANALILRFLKSCA